MLCKSITKEQLSNYLGEGWIAEIKSDGTRARICMEQDRGIQIFSRRGEDITFRYPELVENFKPYANEIIIDGEIIMRNKKGISDFSLLQSTGRNTIKQPFMIKIMKEKSPVIFVAFDIIRLNDDWLYQKPLKERIMILEKSFKPNKSFELVERSTDINRLRDEAYNRDEEGIILKNLNSTYENNKRSNNWIKLKFTDETDIKFTDYEINPKGLTLKNEQGIRCACLGQQSGVVKDVMDKEGEILCSINHLGKTRTGLLRQPTFKKLVVI